MDVSGYLLGFGGFLLLGGRAADLLGRRRVFLVSLGVFAIASAALLLLVFTVVEAPDAGWGSARTLGSLAGTGALLAAFVMIERRAVTPLVRLGILRSGALVGAPAADVRPS